MATEEHKYLADIIKNTHATLREEARNYGAEVAWKRHVSRKDVLQKYATSMQKLATTYWAENNSDIKASTCSRIEWIRSQCKEYYLSGGKEKYDKREEDIKLKIDTDKKTEVTVNCNIEQNKDSILNHFGNSPRETIDKVSLLDVGSCYNPFEDFDMFEVTAIDLNSVPDKVLRCDFLNMQIGKEKILSEEGDVLQLPENSFHVVIFSLFLEYLPCPKQRYTCCKSAYDLLQPGGILFIISPDSKHVGANARIIKSWRYALSKLGFMRIKYEKLKHMHCIIFRKCVFEDVASRWANLQKLPQDDVLYLDDSSIYIPQDFRNVSNKIEDDEEEEREGKKYDVVAITEMFSELPFEQI